MVKKFKISKKAFRYALLCGLISSMFLSMANFEANCEDLRQNLLRLHIIANSNSKTDQELKLKVRDRILSESGDLFSGVSDIDSAVMLVKEKIDFIQNIALDEIKKNGFHYGVRVTIDETYFSTRVYDDFTLPAGIYESLIINIGKGEGKNWWCVIFPEICLPAASESDLNKTVNKASADISYSPNRYILRFKAVEIYEKIKKFLKY